LHLNFSSDFSCELTFSFPLCAYPEKHHFIQILIFVGYVTNLNVGNVNKDYITLSLVCSFVSWFLDIVFEVAVAFLSIMENVCRIIFVEIVVILLDFM